MADVQIVEWHPYAKKFPLLEGEEFIVFREKIRKRQRQSIKYRVLRNGRIQGIDGRNRLRACQELGKPPFLEKVELEDDEVEEFIDDMNLHRRHLEKEFRQGLVADRRSQGQSVRQIAEELGVSSATVQRDLEEIQVSHPETVPDRITGKDGRSHPAAKPIDPTKLCPRCARNIRTGKKPVKACLDCKALKIPANGQREPGDDTEAEVNAARREKGKRKPGQVLFDWKNFNHHFRKLYLMTTEMRKAYGKPQGPSWHGLRRKMLEFDADFRTYFKELSGTNAPRRTNAEKAGEDE